MRQTDSTEVCNHPVKLMGQRCGASEFWRHRIAGFIFSWWCVVFFLIPGLLTSGCVSKEDLEKAESKLSKVTTENKELSDQIAGLQQEKTRLTDESAQGKKEIEDLKVEIDKLKLMNTAIEKRSQKLGEDFETSKQENVKLTTDLKSATKEIEELKKRIADFPAKGPEQPFQQGSAQPVVKPNENLTPCDAVLEFMRASAQVVRSSKGDERNKALNKLKTDYAEKWSGAPKKAIDSAQAWVKELSRSWDKHHEDTVLQLLKHKKSVLKACGKDDSEAGF